MADTFLLAGGGTAGHVNPLLATAAELRARGFEAVALGTAEGLEADLVPRAGVELRVVPRAPLPRRPNGDAVRFPGRLRAARRLVAAAIAEVKPRAVIGFGGYVSTPAYLEARRAGVPYVVHEANAKPGLANRWGARHAAAVAVTFPGTPLRGAVLTGLPLRAEIQKLAGVLRDPAAARVVRGNARDRLGWPDDALGALVMGGSLGAARVNAALAGTIEAIAGHGAFVLHLTGRGKADEAERAKGDLPAKLRDHYVVREYEHDMATAFAAVDAIVCRSGAATVAEVTALGVPALYVPLAHGNGEQALNARGAVDAGAARMVLDADLTPGALLLGLEEILFDGRTRLEMARAASGIGIVDGAARLVDLALEHSGASA